MAVLTLTGNLLEEFGRTPIQGEDVGDTGLGDLGLKCFMQDFMRLPARLQKVGRTIRTKRLMAHADPRALVTAIASIINARKFGQSTTPATAPV